ncbi:DUF3054 domain-containing protein [Nocardioides yefusunii]|uniref:DUF3054 domain-containing protein n=1 Tax=Nocardioides yefusunii TaxID=2500546 RepID=A0ABW1QZF8_9ACTN|nr:DUF3054 domain-containing protein [Nocardioides yefusunii]
MNSDSPYLRRLGPFALDVVLVVVFATLGSRTHEGGLSLSHVADVAWPFLVGLGVVHAVARRPWSLQFGLTAWLGTVAIGMLLRQATDEGTAFSFVVVATLFNLATLVGWRLVALALQRRNA